MSTHWNYLVIAVDRLNAGLLGPYGNTWVPTRAINRLAGDSWLAEFLFATSGDLRECYRSMWRGAHPESAAAGEASLIEAWRAAGHHTLLVTDAIEVATLPDAAHFDERLDVPLPQIASAAHSTPETHCAQLFGALIERLTELPPKFAIWLHARGMSGPWDAPTELRDHVRDDEDPPAATFVEPPALRLPPDFDPDDLLPITQAYAAQVLVVDECLEALDDAIKEAGLAQNTLVVLTSPRGYLLGQHGYIGASHDAALEDLLHLPLLVRYPDGLYAAERELALLEPRDVFTMLQAPSLWAPKGRDRICIAASKERALRTPAWHLRTIGSDMQLTHELYAKPDDRYEANDVAGRCQDTVEALVAARDVAVSMIRGGQESKIPPLADDLCNPLR